MDFAFPSFTRASTDLPFTQPPQKSLLELVVEAKGRLGLVPQRKPEKRIPGTSFTAFSDSDEESNGSDAGDASGGAGEAATAVLTTRTAWVPPTHLLDYFFSGPFMQAFLTLHNITSSRPAAMLAPPVFSVRDMQLHPVVEAALCAALQESSTARDGGGRGRGWGGPARRDGRVGDAAALLSRPFTTAAAAPPPLLLYEAAKLEQLKDAVFGDSAAGTGGQPLQSTSRADEVAEDAHAAEGSMEDTDAAAVVTAAADGSLPPRERTVSSLADSAVAQRVLFRGLQQAALPALLLGDHVLMSGPRGIGKRTAAVLAAAANVLTLGTAATPVVEADEGEEKDAKDVTEAMQTEKEEGEATEADTATKAEDLTESTVVGADTMVDAGERHRVSSSSPAEDHHSGLAKTSNDAEPRALFVLPSYADVMATAQWLESIFGPEAFVPYTFQKDSCSLRPLFTAATEPGTVTTTAAATAAPVNEFAWEASVTRAAPVLPAVSGGRPAYLVPPTGVAPLPFIFSGTTAAADLLPVTDPTQAGPVLDAPPGGVLCGRATPDISELAALVLDTPLPAPASVLAPSKEEITHGGHKRRRHSRSTSAASSLSRSTRSSDGDGDGGEHHRRRDADRRPTRTSSRHTQHEEHRAHRHRRCSDDGDDEEEEEERYSDSRRSRSRRRHEHRHHRSSHVSSSSGRRRYHSRHRRDHSVSSNTDDEDRHRRHHRSRRGRGRDADREREEGSDRHERRSRRQHHRSSSKSHRREQRHESDEEIDDKHRSVGAGNFADSKVVSSTSSMGLSAAGVKDAARDAATALPTLPPSAPAVETVPSAEADEHLNSTPTTTAVPPCVTSSTALTVTADPVTTDAALDDPNAWLPAALRQRIPVLLTTYHSLQTAMEVVGGEAAALPPLEHVRVAVLTTLERALAQPLKDSFSHVWWVSLVNALDVACQFIVTAERGTAEVMGFLTSTVLPDAGEQLLHLDQRDASIWALMNVSVYPVPVEAAPSRDGGDGGGAAGERRPKISGEDIDAAKLTHLFSLIVDHLSAPAVHPPDTVAANDNDSRSSQGARVVVVCSNRREMQLVLTQLTRLFRDQQQDMRGSGVPVRVTDAVDAFRYNAAEVLVVTDMQLADVRVLRDLHQCTQVDLILHFSLPRQLMMQLEKREIAEVLAQRGRAILGHSKPFCSRRWWPPSATSSASVFAPAKVACHVMLTEHNMKGRVGACVLELLSEVNDQ